VQSYRNDPDDLENIATWMTAFRGTPNAASFRLEFPFNGQGIVEDREGGTGNVIPGTLTAKAGELQADFTWLNHTYSHANLNEATPDLVTSQIEENHLIATLLGFSDYVSTTLLTGEYSGITNTTVVGTAYDLGIRYMLVNESVQDETLVGEVVTSYKNPTPNTGIPYPGILDLLLIPRYANNIWYFTTTPEEEADYYNVLYCDGYPEMTTVPCYDYPEILDMVTNQALGFLLDFSLNPTMFHMNNMNNYDGEGRTVMTDFIEMLYAKYNRYYAADVPILSLRTQEIGERMWERMGFNGSGVQAIIGCDDTITITTQSAARIPFTGVDFGGDTETYAGQSISYFEMGDGDTLTIPGIQRVPQIPGALQANTVGDDIVLSWTAPTAYTDGSPLQGSLRFRVYRSTTQSFAIGPATLLDETTDAAYTDDNAAAADYSYAVTAVGVDCWELASAPARWDAPGMPAAPASLTATATGADVSLAWAPVTAYTDGGALLGTVVYRLYRGTQPGFDLATGTLVVETTSTNYIHAAAASSGYSYAVVAVGVDAWGLTSAPARWDAVRTPAAPVSVTATSTGANVSLAWAPVTAYTDGGALLGTVVYRLYRGTQPGFDLATGTLVVETASTSYVHTAAASSGYSYAVVAVGVDAWGLTSAPARWDYTQQPDELQRVFLPMVTRMPSTTLQVEDTRARSR
jgi:hypothetical protein